MRYIDNWMIFILPVPILYLFSVILPGLVLSLILKNQKPRRPSLVAAWLGATLAALIPQTLYVFIASMVEENYRVVFPITAFFAGAVLVMLSLRRIFGTSAGRAILMYGTCFIFQAAAALPLILKYGSKLMPAFYVYCIFLIVSLPIFLAFRRFTVPE